MFDILDLERPLVKAKITNFPYPSVTGTLLSSWYQFPDKGQETQYLEIRKFTGVITSVNERESASNADQFFMLSWDTSKLALMRHQGIVEEGVLDRAQETLPKSPIAYSNYPVVLYEGGLYLEYSPGWFFVFGPISMEIADEVYPIEGETRPWEWHRVMLHGWPHK